FSTVDGLISENVTSGDRRYNKWLNRFAWFTAFATLLLVCSGGMVTSKTVGLAVPDWPTTFGYNMFMFPVSKWIGGIFFEHTHRLIASSVGLLTLTLAVWIWRTENRQSLRNLALIAVAAVILQGILGGLRVTMLKDEIGIFHACLAQAFLGLIVVLALITTRFWATLQAGDVDHARIGALMLLFGLSCWANCWRLWQRGTRSKPGRVLRRTRPRWGPAKSPLAGLVAFPPSPSW